jgi:hypothetical protein
MADPTGAPEASTSSEVASGATADLEASTSKGTWERIKEHKILQWGLGYLGAAIAIAHGQELMAEAFDWPHLIGRILMSVLVLGFPLVLTLAWYHGHKGLKNVGAGADSHRRGPARSIRAGPGRARENWRIVNRTTLCRTSRTSGGACA